MLLRISWHTANIKSTLEQKHVGARTIEQWALKQRDIRAGARCCRGRWGICSNVLNVQLISNPWIFGLALLRQLNVWGPWLSSISWKKRGPPQNHLPPSLQATTERILQLIKKERGALGQKHVGHRGLWNRGTINFKHFEAEGVGAEGCWGRTAFG